MLLPVRRRLAGASRAAAGLWGPRPLMPSPAALLSLVPARRAAASEVPRGGRGPAPSAVLGALGVAGRPPLLAPVAVAALRMLLLLRRRRVLRLLLLLLLPALLLCCHLIILIHVIFRQQRVLGVCMS